MMNIIGDVIGSEAKDDREDGQDDKTRGEAQGWTLAIVSRPESETSAATLPAFPCSSP
jgi:hypothetical protein